MAWRKALRRLKGDERGAMSVMLALSIIPISLAALGAVDVTRTMATRNDLQDALDAAALAAARDGTNDAARITSVGKQELTRNLGSLAGVSDATFVLKENTIVADAKMATPTIILNFLNVAAHAEVIRGGSDVEAALVLDITGSMAGTKLSDLKVAAKDLLDIVLPDGGRTGPYYTKVSVVPYSSAVNVGSTLAPLVRGQALAGTSSTPGSQYFTFTSLAKDRYGPISKTFPITNCVTERTAAGHLYDDAPYTTARVGRHYVASSTGCPASVVQPLTSNKAALKSQIDGFQANGYTAGQIGLAWGWYMVSPTFLSPLASKIPADAMPAAYGKKQLIKAVVLMTDGMFNTAYAKGVISSNYGAAGADERINQTADVGDPFLQAKALCDGMKRQGVVVYTVGFDLANQTTSQRQMSQDLMTYCASKPANVYLPGSGTELKQAFRDIGADMNSLRLSK